jgi:hypothetical protein
VLSYAILYTTKLDEEKSKCTGLAQENGFWLSIIVQLTFTFIHLMDEK